MSIIRPVDVWFVEQVLPHERRLLSVATRFCLAADDARDLVQDVLLRMLSLQGWESVGDPYRYMLRMVRNAAIDRLRHAKVIDFQSLAEIEDFDIADLTPDQHRLAEDRETLRRLVQAVDALPERCRIIFLRCRVDGASPRDIARELDISLSTLEKRLARAIVLLSAAMAPVRGDPIEASFALWTQVRRAGARSH